MRTDRGRGNEWVELTETAREASGRAYAPYSGLRVGAALEGKSGRVYAGCNVENSSFGLTTCAERVAVQCAVAHGESDFRRLAIYTPDAEPLSPCGACRQVLAEFAQRLEILTVGRGELHRELDLADLLPDAFGLPAGERREQQEV